MQRYNIPQKLHATEDMRILGQSNVPSITDLLCLMQVFNRAMFDAKNSNFDAHTRSTEGPIARPTGRPTTRPSRPPNWPTNRPPDRSTNYQKHFIFEQKKVVQIAVFVQRLALVVQEQI